jgi:hypothetical protein
MAPFSHLWSCALSGVGGATSTCDPTGCTGMGAGRKLLGAGRQRVGRRGQLGVGGAIGAGSGCSGEGVDVALGQTAGLSAT